MAEQPLNHDSSAVQKHLEIMQGVINRMAENSRSCKVWCITLVAAMLVLAARTGVPNHALIALAPMLPFLLLDSYYLALERAFICSQNLFVGKLHRGELEATDLYRIKPCGMGVVSVVRRLSSVSIWLFYLLVAAAIALARLVVLP